MRADERDARVCSIALLRQFLHFCTSNASKLSTIARSIDRHIKRAEATVVARAALFDGHLLRRDMDGVIEVVPQVQFATVCGNEDVPAFT